MVARVHHRHGHGVREIASKPGSEKFSAAGLPEWEGPFFIRGASTRLQGQFGGLGGAIAGVGHLDFITRGKLLEHV